MSNNDLKSAFLPFHYQASNVTFGEWVSLFTVTFAVILAHVIVGVPFPSILTRPGEKLPAWHDRIVLFNPTTIIWRYMAIIDRRLRTQGWTAADMAAANALFWTSTGWDGSESMITTSLLCFVKLPEKDHMELISIPMLQTLIVTVQGINAIYMPVHGLTSSSGAYFASAIAVDQIFFPLAVFGLIRVCASYWLTDDYAYLAPVHGNDDLELRTLEQQDISQGDPLAIEADYKMLPPRHSQTTRHLLTHRTIPRTGRLLPATYWPCRIARFVYVVILGAIWAIDFKYVIIGNSGNRKTAAIQEYDKITTSLFMFGMFFLFLLTVTIGTFAFYYLFRETKVTGSTVIPCARRLWYKIYTVILALFALALLTVTALETRKVACGKFTTYPYSSGADGLDSLCPGLVQVGPNQEYSGLGNSSEVEGGETFLLTDFTGSCQGQFANTSKLAKWNKSSGNT